MSQKVQIALAPGDGIGPEIMDACLSVFEAAGVHEHIEFIPVEMGSRVFAAGDSRGFTDEAVETVERTGLLYKGPMGTPIGGGGKSINVTLRKTFGAFANLRHFQSLPSVDTVFSRAGVPVDIYVVRENIEDTYGGIEHRLTNDVVECKRLISAPGCDQVHRFAFKAAARFGIKKIHCAHKANIMKMTDGLFLDRFHAEAKHFPDIETTDVIIDALCMNLVLRPEEYQMIVLTNLQGDIVSDLAAGLVGGLGFAPSANIGDQISIFEAVHGTAPDIAGKGVANPTSLLLSGLMLLRHIGMLKQAATIENALLAALEDGVHTGDVRSSNDPVGTNDFAGAITSRLGSLPSGKEARPVPEESTPHFTPPTRPSVNRLIRTFETVESAVSGCDIYIDTTITPLELAQRLERLVEGTAFKLTMISNRGTQVWPTGSPYTEIVDYFRVRLELRDPAVVLGQMGQMPTIYLLAKIAEKFQVIDFQPLKYFDGKPGYSLAQGQ
ncbi:MAG: isocitrate/isopropylmalate family dehydrogenase [Planctomycetota bacterium]|nr:isocitrate/isopropylmalate family dehydrogenase [Planctomycetota bacterium]